MVLGVRSGLKPPLAKFAEFLRGLENTGIMRWSFLDGMFKEIDALGLAQCEGVALAIARFDETLEADILGSGEWGRARSLMFAAFNRLSRSPRIQSILVKAILEAGPDRVALEIVGFCTDNRRNNNVMTDLDGVDGDGLKAAFEERMEHNYPIGSLQPIVQRRRDLNAFLYWSKWSKDAGQAQREFFKYRFEHDVHEIPRFLHWVSPIGEGYTEHPLTFLDRFYLSQEVHRLISEQVPDVWDADEKIIIDKFLERWAERAGGNLAGSEGIFDIDADN